MNESMSFITGPGVRLFCSVSQRYLRFVSENMADGMRIALGEVSDSSQVSLERSWRSLKTYMHAGIFCSHGRLPVASSFVNGIMTDDTRVACSETALVSRECLLNGL
jgi:hypothetical protein